MCLHVLNINVVYICTHAFLCVNVLYIICVYVHINIHVCMLTRIFPRLMSHSKLFHLNIGLYKVNEYAQL